MVWHRALKSISEPFDRIVVASCKYPRVSPFGMSMQTSGAQTLYFNTTVIVLGKHWTAVHNCNKGRRWIEEFGGKPNNESIDRNFDTDRERLKICTKTD